MTPGASPTPDALPAEALSVDDAPPSRRVTPIAATAAQLAAVRYNEAGLVPAVVVDHSDGQVLIDRKSVV